LLVQIPGSLFLEGHFAVRTGVELRERKGKERRGRHCRRSSPAGLTLTLNLTLTLTLTNPKPNPNPNPKPNPNPNPN